MYPQESEGHDLRDYLGLLRRRGWILLICAIVLPVAVYKYTQTFPKSFQASTTLQVQAAADSGSSLLGGAGGSNGENIQAVASYVGTTAVADQAAQQLHMPKGSLYGAAVASADQDTGFVTITATRPTAKGATATANGFAAALNATRGKRGVQAVDTAIQRTESALAKTPKSDIATRQQLQQQLGQLATLRQAQSQNLQVLQPALGATQVAPHPKRNAIIALILALLIGAGFIAVAERFDRKVHKPEDLEKLTGVPFLATIPHDAFPGSDSGPEVHEAFQTLRNSLTYFNADGALHSVVVTSGLKGEGKTTVAANLALAYASFGKRVILVDTDLRKPDLANRLGFQDSIGLSQVIAGTVSLEDALQEVPQYGSNLRLLPAGPIPPNPSALLGSQRMAGLMEELSADADLVILDTAPVLMVSDAFPLLEMVSGVVVLARLDKSPRDAIRRLVQIIAKAGGQTLGMVATDGKKLISTGYGYGYGYGYGEKERREREAASETVPPAPASSNGTAEAPVNAPDGASSGV